MNLLEAVLAALIVIAVFGFMASVAAACGVTESAMLGL